MTAVKSNRAKNLEMITPSTLLVGVDGHAKNNIAAFRNSSFAEPRRPLEFCNNRQGFEKLLKAVRSVMDSKGFSDVIFVLEPNGPYWLLLGHYLSERNYIVRAVNPLQVKRNRQTEDPSTEKNDYKDARSASDLGVQGKFNQTSLAAPIYEQLSLLTGLRERLISDKSAYKHMLRSLLVRSFPELKTCVSDIFCQSVRSLLRIAPSASEICILGVDAVAEVLKASSKGRFGAKKAGEIVQAASESVGYLGVSEALQLEFSVVISTLEEFEEKICSLDQKLVRLLAQTPEGALILSIPGIGPITAAGFLGQTASLGQYSSAAQINKLAGLDLVKQQSADHCSATRISKKGRSLLRKILYHMAVASIRCNEHTSAFYQSLIKVDRPNRLKKKQALVAVMGKLVRTIFSVVRSGKPYSREYAWVAPGQSVLGQAA